MDGVTILNNLIKISLSSILFSLNRMDPMKETNYLLQEILQEIREVKAHVIPTPNVRPAAASALSSPAGSGSPVILGQKPLTQDWILKPYEKGPKKGANRWYHEKSNTFSNQFHNMSIKKSFRSPEDQAKIDERVAKMKAAREAKRSAAGGAAESYSTAEERTRKRKIHRNRTRKA